MAINLILLDLDPQPPASALEKWRGHAIGFASLTLPVIAYFSLAELSPLRASFGKALLGLKLAALDGSRARPGAILIRNALKFLPWEIAHAAIWHVPGRPFLDPAPTANLAVSVFAMGLAASAFLLLFIASGRTLHDRLSGLVVIKSGAPPG